MNLPERDWKYLSRFRPLVLDRLCRRILAETRALVEAWFTIRDKLD